LRFLLVGMQNDWKQVLRIDINPIDVQHGAADASGHADEVLHPASEQQEVENLNLYCMHETALEILFSCYATPSTRQGKWCVLKSCYFRCQSLWSVDHARPIYVASFFYSTSQYINVYMALISDKLKRHCRKSVILDSSKLGIILL